MSQSYPLHINAWVPFSTFITFNSIKRFTDAYFQTLKFLHKILIFSNHTLSIYQSASSDFTNTSILFHHFCIETSFMQWIAPQDWLGIGHSSDMWSTPVSGQKKLQDLFDISIWQQQRRNKNLASPVLLKRNPLIFCSRLLFQNKMIAHGPHVNRHSCANRQEGIHILHFMINP